MAVRAPVYIVHVELVRVFTGGLYGILKSFAAGLATSP
jgi:hypothetical protein